MHLCVVRGHRDSVWRPEPPPGGKAQGESGPAERRAAGCATAQKRENEDENRLGVEGGASSLRGALLFSARPQTPSDFVSLELRHLFLWNPPEN